MTRRAWTALSLVGAADVATTHAGLSAGYAEANPAAVPFIEAFGTPGLMAMKGAVILAVYAAVRGLPNPAPDVTAYALASVWLYAVGSNLSVVHSLRPSPFVTGCVFAFTGSVVFGTSLTTGWLTRQTETTERKPGVGA